MVPGGSEPFPDGSEPVPGPVRHRRGNKKGPPKPGSLLLKGQGRYFTTSNQLLRLVPLGSFRR